MTGIFLGAAFFFFSFPVYRMQRKVLDTPLSRCDAIAVGTVSVNGTAHGAQVYSSLFSEEKSLFFQYVVYKRISSFRRDIWEKIGTFYYPPQPSFTLTDEYGSIVVMPEGSKLLDPYHDFFLSIGTCFNTHFFGSAYGTAPKTKAGYDMLKSHGLLDDVNFKVEETLLEQDSTVYVYGFARETDTSNGALIIGKSGSGDDFLVLSGTRRQLILEYQSFAKYALYGAPLCIIIGTIMMYGGLGELGGTCSIKS